MIRTVQHFITSISTPTIFKLLIVPQISLFGHGDTQVSNPYKAAIEIKFKISVFTF